jgi:DNA-binding response OmpR family regulator
MDRLLREMTFGIMAKVLLVSYIPELLRERERVLLAAGHEPTLEPTLASASSAIAQQTFDAAVLDFSVPDQERKHLALALKQSYPDTKIIMLYFSSLKNTELADALMPTSATAQDILRAVNYLLNEGNREQTG